MFYRFASLANCRFFTGDFGSLNGAWRSVSLANRDWQFSLSCKSFAGTKIADCGWPWPL
jgi:hypothetical protein